MRQLQFPDVCIILVYIAVTVTVGMWFHRRAKGSAGDYFLGGRTIPWWLLGISGMAAFVDMGGTARQGAGFLLWGAKGFWLCLDGAVALLLAFQMVYVAKWLRRSGAMTNAEWMVFRFGDGKHGQLARVCSALSALVICCALMTFFFTGTSQVLKVFIPDVVQWIEGTVNPTVITTAAPHALTTGDVVIVSGHHGSSPKVEGKPGTPVSIDGERTVSVTGPQTFTIKTQVLGAGTGGSFKLKTAAGAAPVDIVASAPTRSWTLDGGRVIALLFILMVATYTVSAGFYGVVYADFVQAMLVVFLMLYIGVKAFLIGTPEYFAAHAPAGWLSLWPTNGQWIPALPGHFDPALIKSYVKMASGFSLLLIYWIANNVLQGIATPFDAWTAQRYYAAKNERQASLAVWEWILLWSMRFFLMAGVGVLALGIVDKIAEPEHAMSAVINHYAPVGVVGILLAALFAAQMSTINATANSSAAYFVKDIYMPLRPRSTSKEHIWISYAATLILLFTGVIVGWTVPDVNSIWAWIMAGVFVGTLPPNIAKWFFWRANGWSFAGGTLAGIFGALLTNIYSLLPAGVLQGLQDWVAARQVYEGFAFVLLVSTIGTLLGMFLSKPTDMPALVRFYEKTRPFGFWGPVRAAANQAVVAEARVENRRDLGLLPVACAWQLSLFLMLSSIMFKAWGTVGLCAAVFGSASVVLYKVWYKNLKAPEDTPAQAA